MKVRWRQHEAVLVVILAVITIAGYIWKMLPLSQQQMETAYAAPFIKAHIILKNYKWILLFQTGAVLFFLALYFYINRFVIRSLLAPGKGIIRFFIAASQVFTMCLMLHGLINYIAFYANPYDGAGSLSVILQSLGFHPQPLRSNAFIGWELALFFAIIYLLYLAFREAIIAYYERSDIWKSHRILILNQVTAFLVVFLAVPFFTSVFKLVTAPVYYTWYFAVVPTVMAVFINNIYRIFPLKGEKSFFSWLFIGSLLLTSHIYSFIFSLTAERFEWNWTLFLSNWAIQLFFTTPVSWLEYQQRKDKIVQLRSARMALVKSNADLKLLRSQINSHFLFNVLNALYGTALMEGANNTAGGVQKLGDMMRFMLHESTADFIPMNKEIEYLENYISLQKLRTQTSPDIIIEDNITGKNCDCMIAPMLLIPFVENAFKHGVSLTERSWIKIKLECSDKDVSFEVRNSVHITKKHDPEMENSGIGLQNVQNRLQILYKDRYQFIAGLQAGEFVVQLKIEPVTDKH